MNKLLFLFPIILSPFLSVAQYSLKGRVMNRDNQPLDYTDINLSDDENNLHTLAFTDANGFFGIQNIKENQYTLQINYFGAKIYQQQILINQDIDLHTIIVNAETDLDEIVVKSTAKLVERKSDRIIYNVANSIAAQGTSALQALNTTPMVKVNDHAIDIIGKGTASIMINNRPIQLSDEALLGYLSTLRSDSIDKIEIITTPPSKYDAAGNGGIINIITKTNSFDGLHGTITSSLAYNKNYTWNGNGTISFQNNNWNFMAKLSSNSSDYWNSNAYNYRSNEKDIRSLNIINGTNKNQSASITTNYNFNNKSIIGIAYDYTNLKGIYTKENTTDYIEDDFLTDQIEAIAKNNSKNAYHLLNLFFEHNTDTLGSKLFLGANFFTNNPNSKSDVKDKSDFTTIANSIIHDNNLKYTVYSSNLDFTQVFNWATVEMGAKYTHYNNKLTMNYFNVIENNSRKDKDKSKSNRFNYTEENIAAYIDFDKRFDAIWQIKAGIRYEATETASHLLETDENHKNKYCKWFPSVHVYFTPNEKHSLSLNYAKRIERPHAKVLNPFKYYDNTYSYNGGNPQLLPTYTETIEANYAFANSLNISLSYQNTTDTFDQLTILDDNIFKTTYYNMLDTKSISLTLIYNFKPLPWWETNLSARTFTNNSKYTTNTNQIPQNGINFYYLFYNTFNLSHTPNINLFINWLHQLPSKEDNTAYHGFKNLSSGVNLKLLDSNLNINTSFTDILNTVTSRGSIYFTDNTQHYFNKWNAKTISLSATYSFGNARSKKEIKEITFEDSERSKI